MLRGGFGKLLACAIKTGLVSKGRKILRPYGIGFAHESCRGWNIFRP